MPGITRISFTLKPATQDTTPDTPEIDADTLAWEASVYEDGIDLGDTRYL